MSGLFEKLNVLLRAQLSGVIDDVTGRSPRGDSRTPMKGAADSVEGLRERINQAIAYEDELERQIADIEREIATLNRQADDAVRDGKDAMARYYIEKVYRQEQRLEIYRADLDTHRLVAEELILAVNQLDAAFADKMAAEERRTAAEGVTPTHIPLDSEESDDASVAVQTRAAPPHPAPQGLSSAEQTDTPPSPAETTARPAVDATERFNKVFTTTQERMRTLGEAIEARKAQARQVTEDDSPPDPQQIEDDLTARRNRLTRR